MAALDFPNSPTVNQLFVAGNGVTYQWNGTFWLPVGGTTALYIGDTPPSSPGAGQLWFNSTDARLYVYYNDGNSQQWVPAAPIPGTPSGSVVQTVFVETGAVATGTTIIPGDNTIPQQTEGDQYMSLSITPRSATSRLIIEVVFVGSISLGNTNLTAALFQDSTANALAAGWVNCPNTFNPAPVSFKHIMTSGTTSATTFKVRAGPAGAATVTFNGVNGTVSFGGVMASSIVIQEVA